MDARSCGTALIAGPLATAASMRGPHRPRQQTEPIIPTLWGIRQTMRLIKSTGLGLLATIVLGGIAAAPAVAVPEFLHEGKELVKKGFTVKSATATMFIEVGPTKYKIVCKSSSASGKVKGTKEVEGVVLKLKGCHSKESEELHECEVNSTSPLGAKEEIITKTLKGGLGVVAKAEAASERGLLLTPVSGSVFVTIKSSPECVPQELTEIKGSLIGEIKPVKTLKLKGELAFKSAEETKVQMIKKFTGETGTHFLELYEVRAPLEALATTEFEETFEVT
jgi:hypothetical protein